MHRSGGTRPYAPRAAVVALAATALVVAAACGASGPPRVSGPVRRPSSTTTTSTTTTTVPPTTTTTAPVVVPPAGLGPGSSGPEVAAVQERLKSLRFDVPTVDGRYGYITEQAVMAFQKLTGMPRTGRATPDVVARLAGATLPGPMVPGGGADRIEIDIARQVLLFWQGGELDRVLPVSSGSGEWYCARGRCSRAVTPGGAYRVRVRTPGWTTGYLGRFYNGLFFNGGIGVHGSTSVPAYPASHGCVRIPMHSAEWLFGRVPHGTPVYVLNGPNAPVPLGAPAPTVPDRDQTPGDRPPTTRPPTTPPTTRPTATTSTSTTTTSTTTTTTTTTTTVPPGP